MSLHQRNPKRQPSQYIEGGLLSSNTVFMYPFIKKIKNALVLCAEAEVYAEEIVLWEQKVCFK